MNYTKIMVENLYQGCSGLAAIPTIKKGETISSEDFFSKYIATRTPTLFEDALKEPEWKAGEKWNHSYFREKIPKDELLKVEYRQYTSETFGKGNELKLSFHDLLTKFENQDENYYLTTQDLEYDEEGLPYVMTSPIRYLSEDFPLNPSLFQTLIVSNINLWYGLSRQPTTSGLHHDYHDNLYILLKGEKTITLYPPSAAPHLYTVGNLLKIHPNGRINYVEQPTFADGRDLKADRAFQAAMKVEELATKQSTSDSKKVEGKEKAVEVKFDDSDDEIDEALDAVLDAEMDSNIDDEDEGFEDEYADDDDDNFGEDEDNVDESESEGNDHFVENHSNKESGKNSSSKKRSSDTKLDKDSKTDKKMKKDPPSNFSRVNTSLPLEEILKTFPEYEKARQHSVTIKVQVGQMLYIPCGWFHEVRSEGGSGHLAVNYWFHPPDQSAYHQPYSSNFWPKQWEIRRLSPFRPLDEKL